MREPEKDPAECRVRRDAEVVINGEIKKAADAYRAAAKKHEQAKLDRASTQNEIYRLQAMQAASSAAGMAPHPVIRGAGSVAGIGLEVALTRAEEKLRRIDGDYMISKAEMEEARRKQDEWTRSLADNARRMKELNCVI